MYTVVTPFDMIQLGGTHATYEKLADRQRLFIISKPL